MGVIGIITGSPARCPLRCCSGARQGDLDRGIGLSLDPGTDHHSRAPYGDHRALFTSRSQLWLRQLLFRRSERVDDALCESAQTAGRTRAKNYPEVARERSLRAHWGHGCTLLLAYTRPDCTCTFSECAARGIAHWFTGNIGYHHFTRRLNRATWCAPRLTLRSSLQCARMKLWDEVRAAWLASRSRRPHARRQALSVGAG